MNIIKLDNRVFDRVLKASDIEALLNVDEYVEQMKQQSEDLLENTNNNITKLKEQIYQEISSEIRTENAKQLQLFYDNLQQMLKQFDAKTFDIIYQVLVRLGYAQINPQQIKNLITDEIGNVIGQKTVKIIANQDVIAHLKEEFEDTIINSITWAVNDQLLNEECICETSLWSLRIDAATLKQQIQNILSVEFSAKQNT